MYFASHISSHLRMTLHDTEVDHKSNSWKIAFHTLIADQNQGEYIYVLLENSTLLMWHFIISGDQESERSERITKC